MVKSQKRKKHHDKDKYYRLAKEQGLRSRAAFKLTQMNRKFQFLQNSSTVIDLCAAPGGWSQIASRAVGLSGKVIAVDIHPIRSISANVTTMIGDITTDACRAGIKREMATHKADVVLCDGAPDVGADYGKDAYEQNEIALSALKCASDHLVPDGVFVTKLYRSRDYTAYLWVVKQFFEEVQAVKPSSSRMTSSEIFLVCKGYKAPTAIDPKLFDPKCVFESLEDGEDEDGKQKKSKMNIFHKKYFEERRSRDGYDYSKKDFFTMRNIASVAEFVTCSDPVRMLTDCTGFRFSCDVCLQKKKDDDDEKECFCNTYREDPATTAEIKTCLADLKVLNRGDFKSLLNWRTLMQNIQKNDDASSQHHSSNDSSSSSDDHSISSTEEEKQIQSEIQQLHLKKLRAKKRIKKKERMAMAKQRRRVALGMENNAIDVDSGVDYQLFSLDAIRDSGDLDKVHEIDLNKVSYDDIQVEEDSDDDQDSENQQPPEEAPQEESDSDESITEHNYRMEAELDDAYDRYLKRTKKKSVKQGTKMEKRNKKALKDPTSHQAEEDAMIVDPDGDVANLDSNDQERYAKMLDGADSDDSGEDDESDDGFHSEPVMPEPHFSKNKNQNPLIHELPDDPQSVKTARWFSNPLFETIGTAAQFGNSKKNTKDEDSLNDSDDDPTHKKGMDAEEVLALMPKTDKQIRHERRLKARARQERKKQKRGENEEGFEIAAADKPDDEDEILTPEQKKKQKEIRELIKAGIGPSSTPDKGGFEVVPPTPLPIIDTRKYNSDNEDYDSDDKARTLAIATMILRPSKTKAFMDASYNRYAWNDPENLPEWFQDDEQRHYRPQLPIPPALMEKMKERAMTLAAKPIAKVAEARARKHKRAKAKLSAARKKAESIANSSDMTETMKLKAISKAMRGQEASRPGKTYVVSKKGGKTKGGKGMKLVDKRMKNDKRADSRVAGKRKKGKQGGLTGSKKRRHHS